MSHTAVGARLQPSDASVYSARPSWNTGRRPNLSPIEPAVSIRLAVAIVYAVIVHCRPATGVCRPWPMSGSARFTTVVSMAIMNRLALHTVTIAARAARPGWAGVKSKPALMRVPGVALGGS
jgi:hypothetical protein